MKSLKIIILFLLSGVLSLLGHDPDSTNLNYQGETKVIDPEAVIFEGAYTSIDEKDPFLIFSDLEFIGKKPTGITKGGVYQDQEGTIWFIKKPQSVINEYLGAKIMRLLMGPYVPEVTFFSDDQAGKYTSAKKILNFITQDEAYTLNEFSNDLVPITEKLKLDFASYLISLKDFNQGNMGYVRENGFFIPARIDFDLSFEFDASSRDRELEKIIYSNPYVDLESVKIATEELVIIPDYYIYDTMQEGVSYLFGIGVMTSTDVIEYLGYTKDIIKRKIKLSELNFLANDLIEERLIYPDRTNKEEIDLLFLKLKSELDNTENQRKIIWIKEKIKNLDDQNVFANPPKISGDATDTISTQLDDDRINLKIKKSDSWIKNKLYKQGIKYSEFSHEFRAIKEEVAFIREKQDSLEKDYLRKKEAIGQRFEQQMTWLREQKSQIEVEEIAIKKRVTSPLTSYEVDRVLRRKFDLEMQERQAVRNKDMELNDAMDWLLRGKFDLEMQERAVKANAIRANSNQISESILEEIIESL